MRILNYESLYYVRSCKWQIVNQTLKELSDMSKNSGDIKLLEETWLGREMKKL